MSRSLLRSSHEHVAGAVIVECHEVCPRCHGHGLNETVEAIIRENESLVRSKHELETENRRLSDELTSNQGLYEDCLSHLDAAEAQIQEQSNDLCSFMDSSVSPHRRNAQHYSQTNISPGDVELLKQAIECPVCLGIAKEPVTGSCCQKILGCKDCITRSMRANGRLCPLCRGADPELTAVRGLDEMFCLLGRIIPD